MDIYLPALPDKDIHDLKKTEFDLSLSGPGIDNKKQSAHRFLLVFMIL